MSTIHIHHRGKLLSQKFVEGKSLLSILLDTQIILQAPCGGKGTCGKCKVKVAGEGTVLSCQYYPKSDLDVYLPDRDSAQILSMYQPNKDIPLKLNSSYQKPNTYGLAIDIGTTSVVFYWVNLQSICVHHFWHDIRILLLICVISPIAAFIFMQGRPRRATLLDFITHQITSVSSQFTLFLAAGVFSAGMTSLTHVYPALFSFESSTFTPLLFAMVSGAMIIIGIIGVHPIVSIAIVSPLLLPLNPDQSQLGFLFLTSWAISTGSSPLSGVGLALVSRYQASPREIIQSNWHYAVVMWAIASVLNVLFFTV